MGECAPDPEPARLLFELLQGRRGLLLERWERRLQGEPHPSAPPALRLDVTALLDRIAARLAGERGRAPEDAGELWGPTGEEAPAAQDLPAMLAQLAHLRAALLEGCAAEGVPLAGEAAVLVHGALDEAMATVAGAVVRRAIAVGKLERERLDLTLRLLPVGVFICDAAGRMLAINDAVRGIWGPEVPLAQSAAKYDVYRGYHPGSDEPIAPEEWALSRALRGEAPRDDEFEMINPSGERRTILNSALALRSPEGVITGGIAVNVDITDRKRTELRLAAILAGALDAIVLIDASGRVLECNPAAERTFGYTREEVLGRELADLIIEPGLRDAHRRGLLRYLATGESRIVGRRVELRAMRADGSLFDAELSVIRLPTGGSPAFAGFIRDITDRKQAERERAREAEFRERFLGILGHDLRTPLSVISVSAHGLLGQAAPGGPVAEGLQRIVRGADRMARMIRDLLDFTRARQGGGIPVTVEASDLRAICQQVLEEVALTHPGRSLALHSRGATGGRWDPDRISQVVQNLLNNAVDYSPADTRVELSVDGTGDRVLLAVTNAGPPIPPELLADLFNPFRRGGHAADSHASEGLGLGLFIAHAIVGAHHGQIRVESDEAHGTTFRVELPRSPTQAS